MLFLKAMSRMQVHEEKSSYRSTQQICPQTEMQVFFENLSVLLGMESADWRLGDLQPGGFVDRNVGLFITLITSLHSSLWSEVNSLTTMKRHSWSSADES